MMVNNRCFLCFVALLAAGVRGVAALSDNPLKWIQVHGWLMWVSMGFLFPLGIILIRYWRPQLSADPTVFVSPQRKRTLLYLHIVVQVAAVAVATTGVALLVKKTGANFDYTHMRMGLAVLILAMVQPFLGFARPSKGTAAWPYWFSIHWVSGTTVVFLGIINCYIGIRMYEFGSGRSIRSLNIAFSIQVAFMALAYFLQDQLSYIMGQRIRVNSNQLDKEGHRQETLHMSL